MWKGIGRIGMNKKIIFFDIDGTVLDERTGKILPSTIAAIQKARENGHYAMINSGRCSYMIGDDLKQNIGFDGYLLGCGTSIKFGGKDLMHHMLPQEMVVELMAEFKACKIDAILEGEWGNYVDSFENMNTELFARLIKKRESYFKNWEKEDKIIDKMFVYTNENSDLETFRKRFEDRLDFIDRERGFWEIVPKGFSKASAIHYIIDYLGMDIKDTVAIGDSNNDISMLACVHTSIAMGNSTRAVLDMADYITTDVNEDGIENALRWLGVL